MALGGLVATTVGGGTVGLVTTAARAAAAGMSVSEYSAVVDVAISTGRTSPLTAGEATLLKQAEQNAGVQIMKKAMSDPRLQAAGEWFKFQLKGAEGTVHYIREKETGIMRDFKFKD